MAGGWTDAGSDRVPLLCGPRKGLGHFEEGKAQLEERAREEDVFGSVEIALRLLREDAKHVDGLAGTEDVHLWLLAGLRASAELQDGLHVHGLDERLKGQCRRMVCTGVGRTNGEVEALGGRVEGAERLLHLFGSGPPGLVVFAAFFR
jgi:hypothetical protein